MLGFGLLGSGCAGSVRPIAQFHCASLRMQGEGQVKLASPDQSVNFVTNGNLLLQADHASLEIKNDDYGLDLQG